MPDLNQEFKILENSVQNKFDSFVDRPRRTLKRFPTLFLLLTTAGVVLVLFGFERTFDKIAFFHDNPVVMIILGIAILIFTGRLYKKLNTRLDL